MNLFHVSTIPDTKVVDRAVNCSRAGRGERFGHVTSFRVLLAIVQSLLWRTPNHPHQDRDCAEEAERQSFGSLSVPRLESTVF